MAKFFKNTVIAVLSVTMLVISIMLIKKLSQRNKLSEELKQNSINDIKSAFNELKDTLEGKSTAQIKKGLDTAIENAKKNLDRVSDQIKDTLNNIR